jgi:subfamily B ATP-binding cassette protein MsbA
MSLVRWVAQRVGAVQRMIVLLGVRRRRLAVLVLLGLVYAGFEGLGVGMLLPILVYLERGPALAGQDWGRLAPLIEGTTAALGLPGPLPVLLLFAFVPMLARQLFRYLHQLCAGWTRFDAVARIRRDAVSAFLRARLPFFTGEGNSRLVSALTTEVERGSQALPFFLYLCEGLILLAVYFVLLVLIATWLVPVVLVAMGLVAALLWAKMKESRRWGQRISEATDALHAAVAERLTGIRLIKMSAREGEETARLDQIITELRRSFFRISRLKEGLEVSVEPVMMLGAFAAMYLAVTAFGMTLASLGLFTFILLRLVPLFRQVNVASQALSALVASLNSVYTVAEQARAAAEVADGAVPFTALRRDITFDRVGFAYELGRPVLLDVSCVISRGSLTAIVGRSGAGKSTMLDLIPRLHDASEGEIRIDDVPLQRFTLRTLRAAIGTVDQLGFLFNDTVERNIGYGLPGVHREAVVEAARSAHAHDFIQALPNGYATVVGEGGVRLSVGQRQRLCLARVLLRDPDILLLDEPTSALDAESEQYIQAVLERLRAAKAIVVVAHRLSTIRRADQIIVLDGGRVVERGDHATLLQHWGTYRQFFEMQIHA